MHYASILDGEIHVISVGSGTRQVHRFPSAASALGLCDSGKLVVALQARVVLLDVQTGVSEVLCEIRLPISQMRLNDGNFMVVPNFRPTMPASATWICARFTSPA
ncbi:SMP-30/gluconolactonase/LRE family protein [uncultured Devosia sp.]|uniref:SMP-30/gluconolactonase/LRE family protein n=1 Tax=uncultured Devosia sp. TaxID=211434 RepID=UPI0035CC00D2